MSVEFSENQPIANYQSKKTGLTGLVIKMKLAKDEAGAKKIMVVITVICFALAIYFFYKALN